MEKQKNEDRCRRNPTSIVSLETNIQRRLQYLSCLSGYPIYNLKYLRKVGPRATQPIPPERGSEIFAHRLPVDALEDELFWFFSKVGEIYDMRLMLRPSGVANRGFAFIRYCNPQQADHAIAELGTKEFRPRCKIILEKSLENNRLFVSGIPPVKTKKQIWDELLYVGMENINDIIVYKSYKAHYSNRGFIFIEFFTHEDAATMRKLFVDKLVLWGQEMILDWAEPLKEIDPAIMGKVRRVFLRNLQFTMSKDAFINLLSTIVDLDVVEKIYKKMDYAFIHFRTREIAEYAMMKLQEYFDGTDVEVTWSKPPQYEGRLSQRILPPRLQKKSTNGSHQNSTSSAGLGWLNKGRTERENQLQKLLPQNASDNACSMTLLMEGIREWNLWQNDYNGLELTTNQNIPLLYEKWSNNTDENVVFENKMSSPSYDKDDHKEWLQQLRHSWADAIESEEKRNVGGLITKADAENAFAYKSCHSCVKFVFNNENKPDM